MNTWKDQDTGETYMWTDPHTGKPLEITGSTVPQNTITFFAGNAKEVLRIERDKITVAEGVEVNEAAQAVLDALQSLLGDWYRQAWNEAIEEAANTAGRDQWDVIMGLKK